MDCDDIDKEIPKPTSVFSRAENRDMTDSDPKARSVFGSKGCRLLDLIHCDATDRYYWSVIPADGCWSLVRAKLVEINCKWYCVKGPKMLNVFATTKPHVDVSFRMNALDVIALAMFHIAQNGFENVEMCSAWERKVMLQADAQPVQ